MRYTLTLFFWLWLLIGGFVPYGITNLFYTQLFDVQAPMSGTSAVTITLPIALFFLLVVVVLAFLQRHQERKAI